MRVLLAIDGSPFSGAPLREAATRVWPPGTILRVLTVAEPEYPVTFVVPDALLMPPARALNQQVAVSAAEALVERIAETVRASGQQVETSVRQGRPGEQIVEEARSWGAELILLGTHGRTGLKRLLMGSVAEYVVSHAPCSVEVVRSQEEAGEALGDAGQDAR